MDGTVEIEEFINVFFEAEKALKTKIENAERYVNEYKRQRKDAISQLEEIRKSETLKPNGVSTESHLELTLLEVRNLVPSEWNGNSCEPVVTFHVNTISKKSFKGSAINHTYNQHFQM